MRQLTGKDLGPFTKLLSKMELKEAIKAMFSTTGKKNKDGDMVSELVWGVIENYYKAEADLHKFLASLEGKTVTEIADLPLDEFISLIKELFSKKNLSFFNLAVK